MWVLKVIDFKPDLLMKTYFQLRLFIILVAINILLTACPEPKKDPQPSDTCATNPTDCGCPQAPASCNDNGNTTSALGKGQAGVVGTAGIADWDKLSASEKNRIKGWKSLFVHASVGGDLEDGSESNGFKFEFYDGSKLNDGMNGADWNSINNGNNISNGEPEKKIAAFKREALEQKGKLQIAIFKFGYADITDANLEATKTLYKAMIDELRAAGLRFVHITPPLIYIATKDDGNEAKMKMAAWMKSTFTQDVIFDIQACESRDGACKLGNVWRICEDVRSTSGCPSKGQGVDSAEGQGHLCEKAATNISKAFLMSIYNVGK